VLLADRLGGQIMFSHDASADMIANNLMKTIIMVPRFQYRLYKKAV
jgi:hypothetical protein